MTEIGSVKTLQKTVTPGDTARAVASGTLEVLATPVLIAWMEEAAQLLAGEGLEQGKTSVGTLMNMQHLAATPVGMQVCVRAELREIDRRRLVFSVSAEDACGVCARADHERFVVDAESFLRKANDKLNN